ncbi:MAG TPA: acyl-CoA desaturase, partial [Roseiflexaceae bacterium]|nr:acyl-CoA desaturase [Roseiflexaceae bacterium]
MVQSRAEKALLLTLVIVPLAGTLFAMYLLWNWLVSWQDIAILAGMFLFTSLGITVGYHRMLTHRSFEAHPVVRFLFLLGGSMAIQGPAVAWASIHIKHHANSDDEDDPHSPLKSFFHGHVGWFLDGYRAEPEIYGKWLLKDRMVMFMSRWFPLWVILSLLIPFLLGGWTGLLWGGLVRIFLNHHITWSVNSVCHTFGKRMFETTDHSRNNWIVGLLALGEGWHNNHHAFPRSAFHGMRWYQFDLSSYIIWALERVGLVRNVVRISPEKMEERLVRAARAARAAARAQAV